MAITYVSRKRINPRDIYAEPKYYPSPAYVAEIGIDTLCEKISEKTTLTRADIKTVIASLLSTVPDYLMLGYKVRLDDFGIFKIGFKSTGPGQEKATDVTSEHINGLKILYTPDVRVNEMLSKPTFAKIDAAFLKKQESSEAKEESESKEETGSSSGEGS